MSHAPNASGSSRRLVASVAIVALLLGAWHLTGEAAQARILSLVAGPSSVAVIDVQSVLSQLDERVKLEEDLGTLGSKLENEVNSLKAEADTLAEDLDVYDPSSAEFKAQRRKVEAATARWRIQGELANRVVLEERSDLQRLLFQKIMDSTRAYAESEGWDIVLIDDSKEGSPRGLSAEQFGAFLSTRSVAYRAENVDISDAVATALNNQFRNNVKP